MYSGTVRRVSRQDIKLVTVPLEMEDNVPKTGLYDECFCPGSFQEYISWLNTDKKPLHVGDTPKHGPEKRFQSKRTQERDSSNEATVHGESLENTRDSSLEKKSKKPKSCIPSSYPCFPTRQNADCSNPSSDPKDDRGESPKDKKTRAFIPIGPGFQAEIPVWIAPTKKGKFYGSPGDSKTLRWLGTGVWPTYSLKKTVHYKKVGEGRSDSCSCATPWSTSCIRKHIKEARELLEKEIGRAFSTWKFDEMGEVVAKSWTAKEEQRFVALVRKNPLSNSQWFWECASKSFPRKREKDLISYYHNVYLINRMRTLTNSSDDHVDVDSDDDHNDDFLAG